MYIDFSDDANYSSGFDMLLRELHGVPVVRKPPLGKNPYVRDSIDRSPAPAATHRRLARGGPAAIRIPKEHTDADRDSFLEAAFELMASSLDWSILIAPLQR